MHAVKHRLMLLNDSRVDRTLFVAQPLCRHEVGDFLEPIDGCEYGNVGFQLTGSQQFNAGQTYPVRVQQTPDRGCALLRE